MLDKQFFKKYNFPWNWVRTQAYIFTWLLLQVYLSMTDTVCKHVKARHVYRRFEHVLSKLGRVEKTERLIIYLNKLNWFTEMYLPTMSNTQMLSYWDISHLWKLCTHSPFAMDDHAVKHRTNLTWHICIGTVRTSGLLRHETSEVLLAVEFVEVLRGKFAKKHFC